MSLIDKSNTTDVFAKMVTNSLLCSETCTTKHVSDQQKQRINQCLVTSESDTRCPSDSCMPKHISDEKILHNSRQVALTFLDPQTCQECAGAGRLHAA